MTPPTSPVLVVEARPLRASALLRETFALPSTLWRHRDLLRAFARRDVQARFHGSVLGILWPLLQPALLFLLYYFVFGQVLRVRYEATGRAPVGEGTYFALWLFLGLVVWNAFGATVTRATTVLVDHGHLVKKSIFPTELLPVATALGETAVLHLGLGVFGVAALLAGVPLAAKALLLPALVLATFALGLGFGLATATFHVFVRDTAQIVSVGVLVGMFLSPVFWPPEWLGDVPFAAWLRWNPVYHLLGAWRGAFLEPEVSRWPLEETAVALVCGLAAAFLGYALFLRSRRRFVDEI